MTHLEASQYGSTTAGQEYQAHFSQAAQSHLEPRYAQPSAGAIHPHDPATGSCCGAQNVGNTERVISVVAGLGLALSGLNRGRAIGLLLAAAGAGLVWRGLSGHCYSYKALGINTADHK